MHDPVLMTCGLSFPMGMNVKDAIQSIKEAIETYEMADTAHVVLAWDDGQRQYATLLWEVADDLMWGKKHFQFEHNGIVLEIEMP